MFKNITRSIFLTVVVVGFIAFGGQNWIKESINNFLTPDSYDVIMERAQKVGDFSKIDKEFEIEKVAGLMGYNAVIAEHKASGQRWLLLILQRKRLSSQADIKAPDAEERIKKQFQNSNIKLRHLRNFTLLKKEQ